MALQCLAPVRMWCGFIIWCGCFGSIWWTVTVCPLSLSVKAFYWTKVDVSHTRTVVRECCKGDDASQWRNPKFDSPPHHAQTPYAGIIKIGRGDYVVDPYTLHLCKCSSRFAQGFRFRACVRDFAPQIVRPKGVSFSGVLATRYSQGPWTDFDAKYAQTRGSAQGCASSGSRT